MNKSIKTILGLSFAILLVFNACKDDDPPGNTPVSDPDWNKVELDSTAKMFNSISFDANGTYGWIVGDTGLLITTSDGGQNWSIQPALTTNNLNDIFFFDAAHIWIVGDNGTILFSSNNGESWQTQSCPTEGDLSSVFFVDQVKGWIVGTSEENPSIILHTSNGGQGGSGWNFQNPPENEYALNDIFFSTENLGYIVGNFGAVYETKDGGIVWEKTNQVSNVNIYSLWFITNNVGFAVGEEGEFLNRGQNTSTEEFEWFLTNEIPNYSFTLFDLYTIRFIDEDKGWCAGEKSGSIFYSDNGAVSWSEQKISDISDIYDIYIDKNEFGWAIGKDYFSELPILLKYSPDAK